MNYMDSFTVNKDLCVAIGLNAAIIFSVLLDKHYEFSQKDQLDDEGFFYMTAEELESATSLSPRQQRTAIETLKKLNLIEVKLKTLPAKRHFKIIDNPELLENLLKQGRERKKCV